MLLLVEALKFLFEPSSASFQSIWYGLMMQFSLQIYVFIIMKKSFSFIPKDVIITITKI